MLIRKYSFDRTGFSKPDGTFYEFGTIEKAQIGCGSCKIYSDKSKNKLIKEGYCLDGEYICSETDNLELLRNNSKIEEMFKLLGL